MITPGEVIQNLEESLKLLGHQTYQAQGAREGLGMYSVFDRLEDMTDKEILILCNRLALHQYSKHLLVEIITEVSKKHPDFASLPYSDALKEKLAS